MWNVKRNYLSNKANWWHQAILIFLLNPAVVNKIIHKPLLCRNSARGRFRGEGKLRLGSRLGFQGKIFSFLGNKVLSVHVSVGFAYSIIKLAEGKFTSEESILK